MSKKSIRAANAISKDDFNKEVKLVSKGTYEPNARYRPHINAILDSAHHVLNDQLRMMKEASEAGRAMDGQDVRKFAALVDAAAKLERVEREQAKAFDPSSLATDELLKYADKAKELLGGKADDED